MLPFVLIGCRELPPESEPSGEQIYDEDLQIWVDRASRVPVVTSLAHPNRASQFGETTITETREGADQPDMSTLQASQFGETTVTKTFEGHDQREYVGVAASQFGETTSTRTREGHDQSEQVGTYDMFPDDVGEVAGKRAVA